MANSRSLQPEALAERLQQSLTQLETHAAVGHELTVAFSGGLDSSVLLHLLSLLAQPSGWMLRAVHVHHGLNPAADGWVSHCEQVCDGLGIPLEVVRVDVVPDGRGIEDAARQVRHAALQRVATKGWIVLAHHADDQAETLLQRLVRGTGVAGATAMCSVDSVRRLWRPLLNVPRESLRCWALAQGLSWIEDSSNADESLSRNFIRHRVLAPIKHHFPAGVENMVRACRYFGEAEQLLQELATEDALKVGKGQGSRARLRALGDVRIRNLLRHWIALAGELAPSAVRLENLCDDLCHDGVVHWIYGKMAVCAYRNKVWLEPAEQVQPQSLIWRGESLLPWGNGWISLRQDQGLGALYFPDYSCGEIEIGVRQGGELLQLAANRPHRSLKHLFQEMEVPPWWRPCLPMLRIRGRLAWVAAVGADVGARVGAGELGWRVEWQPAGLSR